MTVIENLGLEMELEMWDLFGESGGFQKLRPSRDGQMPVSRDKARHRSQRRSNTFQKRAHTVR